MKVETEKFCGISLLIFFGVVLSFIKCLPIEPNVQAVFPNNGRIGANYNLT